MSNDMPATTMHNDAFQALRFVVGILESIVWLFSVTLEVFLRTSFGERYFQSLGALTVLFMLMFLGSAISCAYALSDTLAVLSSPADLAAAAASQSTLLSGGAGGLGPTIQATPPTPVPPSRLYTIFPYLFAGVAVFHRIAAWLRARRGVRIHSYYSGTPHGFWWWLRLPVSEGIVKRYGEPALCCGIGFALENIDPGLGLYVLWATIALFIKGQLEYMRAKSRVLDAQDAQLESEYLGEVLANDGPMRASGGDFVVTSPGQPLSRWWNAPLQVTRRMAVDPLTGLASKLRRGLRRNGKPADAEPPGNGPIAFDCRCGQRIKVARRFAGRRARCLGCREIHVIPAA